MAARHRHENVAARRGAAGAPRRTAAVAFAFAALFALGANPAAAQDIDAEDDEYETDEGVTLEVPARRGVLRNDEVDDGDDDDLRAFLEDDVEHGELVLNTDGSFTYTPDPGFSGEDEFTYVAATRWFPWFGDSDEAEVEIEVRPASGGPPGGGPPDNEPPTARDDSYSTERGTALSVGPGQGVLANDTDPDGDSLTAVIVEGASNGDVMLNQNGAFTYTPRGDFSGDDTFRYEARDGTDASEPATVTVSVASQDNPPSIELNGSAAMTIDEGGDFDDPGATASDPEDGNLTDQIEVGGNVDTSDPGDYTLTYSVTDSDGNSESVERTVTVVDVDEAPVVEGIPDQEATETVSYRLDLADFVSDPDTPDDELVYAADGALPDGLELGADGVVSGTPALGSAAGEHRVRFTVSDAGNETSGTFDLTVQEPGDADLGLSISVAPNPVAIDETATWTLTVANNGEASADSVTLDGEFTGGAPFNFDAASDGACTLSASGNETQLDCAFGPLAGGDSHAIELTGSGPQAGDVQASATVALEGDAVDETPGNDSASATLSITQELGGGAAQALSGFDARAAAAGDFDGDGYDDLAVATGADEAVLVFFNEVDPDNADKRVLGESPARLGGEGLDNGIAVADLDGDGNDDIAVAGGPGRANGVFLGDGDGGFEAVDVGGAGADARAVTVGDVDGDAFADLVFANASPNGVLPGGGTSGSYGAPMSFGDGVSRGVVAVDLFGDAALELVFAEADADAAIYARAGDTFEEAVRLETGATTSVAAADFDDDGATDLVFGRDAPGAPDDLPSNLVFLNNSTSSPSFFRASPLGAASTTAVLAVDADLDGDADIVALNSTGAHQIYVNSGAASATFSLHAQQVERADARGLAAGRFSVDDRVDLAVVGADGAGIFYNDGAGNFGLGDADAPTIELVGDETVSLNVGDTWNDPGATATDAVDGDLTDDVVSDADDVDTAVVGDHIVSYEVTDTSGNAATTVTRTVQVGARQQGGGGGGGALGPLALLALLLLAGRREDGAGRGVCGVPRGTKAVPQRRCRTWQS